MIRVLYVDDEEGLLDICKIFLEISGEISVDTIASVREAEKMLFSASYDAIISDYQMPEKTGIQFLKSIRSREDKTPFILFTGRGREEVVIEALNSGADFYLQKGGDPSAQFKELEHSVKEAVRRNRAEKELKQNENRLNKAQAIGETGCWEYNWDQKTGYLWGSEEGFRIFGIKRPLDGAISQEQIEDCIVEREYAHQALADLVEHGKGYDLEYEIVPADGGANRKVRSVAELVRDNEGKAIKVVGVIQDITERKSIEESAMLSKSAMESSLTPMLIMDKGRILAYVNRAFLDMAGLRDKAEIIGKKVEEALALTGEKRKEVFGHLVRDDHWHGPCILTRRDGTEIEVELHISVIRDHLGEPTDYLTASFMSMEDKRRAEKGMIEGEAKLKAILRNASDAILIHHPGEYFVEANRTACSRFGYSREEFLRMRPEDLEDPEYSKVAPQIIEEIMEKGIATYEAVHVTKDGRKLTSEISAASIIHGKRPAIVAVIKDIGEQKATENALRNREEEYSKLIAAIPDLVIRTDINGNIALANDQALVMSGYTKNEVIGRSIFSFIAPEDVEKALKNIELMIGGKLGPVQYHLVMKDGSKVLFEANGDILRDEQGHPTGVVLVGRDITEHNLMESKLKEANRRLRIVESITRHDTMNKLMALQGYLDLERWSRNEQKDLDRLLKMEQIARFLTEQLNVTKEYQSIGVDRPEWQSVRKVCEMAASHADIGKIRLTIDLDGIEVFADPMLYKAFYNLIDNSLKHGKQADQISIGCSVGDEEARILVSDNGPGISDEDKLHLFEEGYGKHHGLGLFLSREIFDITGMKIQEIGEPGKGAKFEIMVPKGRYRFGEGPPAL